MSPVSLSVTVPSPLSTKRRVVVVGAGGRRGGRARRGRARGGRRARRRRAQPRRAGPAATLVVPRAGGAVRLAVGVVGIGPRPAGRTHEERQGREHCSKTTSRQVRHVLYLPWCWCDGEALVLPPPSCAQEPSTIETAAARLAGAIAVPSRPTITPSRRVAWMGARRRHEIRGRVLALRCGAPAGGPHPRRRGDDDGRSPPRVPSRAAARCDRWGRRRARQLPRHADAAVASVLTLPPAPRYASASGGFCARTSTARIKRRSNSSPRCLVC